MVSCENPVKTVGKGIAFLKNVYIIKSIVTLYRAREEKKAKRKKAMQETIQSFTDYLQTEKKASKNTEVSYQRDLRKLAVFLKEHGIEKPRC